MVKKSNMETSDRIFIGLILGVAVLGGAVLTNAMVNSQWEHVEQHATKQAKLALGENIESAYQDTKLAADDAKTGSHTQVIEYDKGVMIVSISQ